MIVDSISKIYPQNSVVDAIKDYRQIKAVFRGENKKIEKDNGAWRFIR